MRSMPLVSVLATAMAVAACQSGGSAEVTDAQRTEITAQVTQVIDSVFTAMNAGDVDAVYGHYRNSDEFISVTVTQFLEGWNAFKSVTSSFFAQHPGVTFQHRIVQTQVLAPNVAAVTIQGSSNEAPLLMWTDVLVREEGRWVITLEHESWPGATAPTVHPAMEAAPGSELIPPDTGTG
ncbi:MAG: nuclear transport factor 2 family protein [Gemmatimonadetes bacterium]|nr:nuclear transport factor 2 family protein [Gemmatimonadota bacterium]